MNRTMSVNMALWLCLMLGGLPAAAQEPTDLAAPLELDEIRDVPYLEDTDGFTHALNVYGPSTGGPWPTAVMIHSAGESGAADTYLDHWARSVASEGAVVFVPYWPDNSPWANAEEFLEDSGDITAQLACAVRFARSETDRYGGDPADLSLFGHSAGATYAMDVAFTDPAVPPGCLADAGSAVPEDLVVFEGEWLELGHPVWDSLIAEDRAVFDTYTPWSYMADAPRIPVTILDSGWTYILASTREDIEAKLSLRDPDGRLLEGLDRLGALDDGRLTMPDTQRLLADELMELGYPVVFLDLPGSSHGYLSNEALAMVTDVLRSGSALPPAE
jgi:acetyl esterase/lipase